MITAQALDTLRKKVGERLSEKRFCHTLGVERAAILIGEHCLPDKLTELSLAALLHDVAKEMPTEEQRTIMESSGIPFTEEDYSSVALYHAFSAPDVIRRDFPEFATSDVLSAVFNHTSGREDMSVFDEIIFIADFVEDGRKYPVCKESRDALIGALEASDSREKKILALHKSVLSVMDFTVKFLEAKGKRVNTRMLLARNSIREKLI